MSAPHRSDAVLVAAKAGDEHAFVELTAPHRAALHRHCYRLLGSLFDADDALQETAALGGPRRRGCYCGRA